MYVCICNAVSDKDINREIEAGARTLEQLREKLNVATGCGHCSIYIMDRLENKLELALTQEPTPKLLPDYW
jgi:bacterioferritin-associated ferredoxin